jgi:hypothetical protein
MPNIVNTSINVGSVALRDEQYRDELLTLAGNGTILAGTILARDSGTLKLVKFVKGGVTTATDSRRSYSPTTSSRPRARPTTPCACSSAAR